MIDIVVDGKTFKGKRSHTDIFGLIAMGFHYNSMGPPAEKVEVLVDNTRYVTDIYDFHDHYANTCYSVFDTKQYLTGKPTFYLIPLDEQDKEN
tara:strand:- start:2762 stop:3040 length:279 start_codon:yes stop_codon:yes gene_type:complete